MSQATNRNEDKRLLAQMRENDSAAFDMLYDKYWEQVYADGWAIVLSDR